MNIIKKRRLELELSQQAVAVMCGITQPQLSKIEAGKNKANKATLERIANALKLEIQPQLSNIETEKDNANAVALERIAKVLAKALEKGITLS
jgi:transcriptional regulator with XRE-family HTH domain